KKQARVVQAPPANPQATAKMVSAVQFAREPSGQTRAVGLLREAVAIDPNLWEAHYNLGILLAQAGDLAGAEAELEKAGTLASGAEDVATALAQVRGRRGEHRRAADGLSTFVEQHPDAVAARMLYVSELRDSGQIDIAIEKARDLLVKRPGDASALSELALSH